MAGRVYSSAFVSWVALLLSGSACNALFSIEEGELATEDGEGSAPEAPGFSEDALGRGPSGATRGGGAVPETTLLPPGVTIDREPLTFSGKVVSHAATLVAGRLNTIHSPLGSAITPDCAVDPTCFSAQTGSEVCVSGSLEGMPNGSANDYWGAQLQIQLLSVAPEQPLWDRASGQVRGLSFHITRLTGALNNVTFQVGSPAATENNPFGLYGVQLPARSDEQHAILFESLNGPPWAPTTPLQETLPLVNIGWQINALGGSATTFDFCLGDIRPIVAVE